MPVPKLFISASQSSCRLLCHSNIRSCSLMCLALSQHHAALALSCALLCLSITLLLLSHVPCLSQHHAALAFSCALLCLRVSRCSSSALYVPCFVWLSITMLSQVLHLSITPLMCLALSQHDITPLFSALLFPYIFSCRLTQELDGKYAPEIWKLIAWCSRWHVSVVQYLTRHVK